MGGDEAGEEGAQGPGDAEGDGSSRNGHSGAGGGEVQPEMGGGLGATAIEDGIGGDQDGGISVEGEALAVELEVAAGCEVEVEAPKGTVDVLVVPVFDGVSVAAVVNDEGRPTGGGYAG